MTTRKPHPHDCDACKPLGQFGEYDLYYCGQRGDPTVIARYGPDGDYLSGLSFADHSEPLGEAKKRALERGYLDEAEDQ